MTQIGLGWSWMVLDGLNGLSESAMEWFKTPKPISGLDGLDGWDGWMDLRVGRGIEHFTVLIKNIILKKASFEFKF